MYKAVRPLLFRAAPERIHDLSTNALALASSNAGMLELLSQAYRFEDSRLKVRRFGLNFPNPVGVAAGLDKNGRAVAAWAALGFGFSEIGSVTALSQMGNPQPRLFRLPEDKAIINRMGFNNDGAVVVARRLERLFEARGKPKTPLGINIGKSKVALLEQAADDYLRSLKELYPFGDYFVVNVSSPNTAGLRDLQEKGRLERLLGAVQTFIQAQAQPKPLLVKLSPDLSFGQLDEVLDLAKASGLAGVIATNTTVSREGLSSSVDEAGGLSGKPLKSRSMSVLRHICGQADEELAVISVGGVATAGDVFGRLAAGASLVQIYTGLVYEGPGLAKRLCRELLKELATRHIGSVEGLIGAGKAKTP